MLGSRKLIVDTHSEIYSMIKDHADDIFWNLKQHIEKNQVVPGAIYVIGREQFRLNVDGIRRLFLAIQLKDPILFADKFLCMV